MATITMRKCPQCKSNEQVHNVIYYGLPCLLCDCQNVLFGFWSWVTMFLPFNGWFFIYDGGFYPFALCAWLVAKQE